MYLKQGLLALLALGPVSAAWAVPATDEGAARLKGVLQTYLGGVEGVVTVTPKGETYDLVVDPAPLLAQVPKDSDLKIEFSTLTYHLTDNGDGTWGVTENQTMSWSLAMPGVMEQAGSAKIESTGIWDESLPGLREQTAVMTEYTSGTTQYMTPMPPADGTTPATPAEPVVTSRDSQITDRVETVLTAKAGTAGGVDHDIAYKAEGMRQTVEMPGAGAMGPMNFEITSPGYDASAKIVGARNDGILNLLAWFVAHPSQELIVGSQDGLRDKLSAAMPLWDDASGTMAIRDFKVLSPFGEFGASMMAVEFGMSGLETDGRFREMLTFSGLTVPEAIMPPWALPLVPQEIMLDFSASDFNLAAPAKMIIEGFDLTADHPMAKVDPAQLGTAFFDGGPALLALAPGHIKGDGYEIGYQGEMKVSDTAAPNGIATISATGLDKIEAALNAAPPEQAQQPLMMLQMAKMLGKPGASGDLVWEIDATDPNGAISVNGQMVAGGTPPQQ